MLAFPSYNLPFSALVVIIISTLLVGINLFRFPYYENDEGTYMSQAWSFVSQGRLSPYEYTYDHAPAGWILIGFWSLITGGFQTFGYTINSGRVLMLVLHFVTSICLYLVTKRLSQNHWVGLVSLLFFALTPLSIYYHRRVLLDNIMTFWVFLSLFLLLYLKPQTATIFSAITFGVAVLTKETALFFLPGFVYLLLEISKSGRWPRIFTWLTLSILIISLYPFYAYTQGQLFPPGVLGTDPTPRPNLYDSVVFQLTRGGGSFISATSSLRQVFSLWLQEDPILMFLGLSPVFANLVLALRFRLAWLPLLFIVPMLLFFIRGGVVYEFYLIPLIPFLGLSLAFFIHQLSAIWGKPQYYLAIILPVLVFDLIWFGTRARGNFNMFTANQTQSQSRAVSWILSQSNPRSFWAIDQSLYLDLVINNRGNFNKVFYYWKIEPDISLRREELSDNPKNIDFIATTPQMETDVRNASLNFMAAAISTARELRRFENDGWRITILTNTPSRPQ